MANQEEEDFDALLDDCAQDLEKKLEPSDVKEVKEVIKEKDQIKEKAESDKGFGMDDPEFAEAFKEVLGDDEQAKEAMKGLAAVMNLIGGSMGTDSNPHSGKQPTPEEAEQALKNMME